MKVPFHKQDKFAETKRPFQVEVYSEGKSAKEKYYQPYYDIINSTRDTFTTIAVLVLHSY